MTFLETNSVISIDTGFYIENPLIHAFNFKTKTVILYHLVSFLEKLFVCLVFPESILFFSLGILIF